MPQGVSEGEWDQANMDEQMATEWLCTWRGRSLEAGEHREVGGQPEEQRRCEGSLQRGTEPGGGWQGIYRVNQLVRKSLWRIIFEPRLSSTYLKIICQAFIHLCNTCVLCAFNGSRSSRGMETKFLLWGAYRLKQWENPIISLEPSYPLSTKKGKAAKPWVTFIWGLEDCNQGDTDLGNTHDVLWTADKG